MNDNFEVNENLPEETGRTGESPENIPAAPGDDDFVIGKGFVVEEIPEETAKMRRKRKRKGKSIIKTLAWIVFILCASAGISFAVIFAGADFLGIGFGRGENCVVEIEPGMSTMQIAERLKEAGAVKWPFLFRVYSKLKGFDGQFKYGVYSFNNEAGYDSLAEMLITEGARAESVTVKIPEMATIDDIAVLLEDAGVCTKSDFIDVVQNGKFNYDFVKDIPEETVYYRLEGYLFPDTYSFYNYDSEECAYLAVDKMLKNFRDKFTEDMNNKVKASKYSLHEIITMASLIESEAGNAGDSDRAKVAAVFYNRLEGVNWDQPKYLQTDPSTKYPHGQGRYDTYKSIGLPPGPIGSPSVRSIKAALSPEIGFKATYFVTDINGVFYFNETLAAHNKTIADLKAKKLWLYTTLG